MNNNTTKTGVLMTVNADIEKECKQITGLMKGFIYKKYGRMKDDIVDDMVNNGFLGLLMARNNYNHNKSNGTFFSYAWQYVKGNIHIVFCEDVLGLTVYYVGKRKKFLDVYFEFRENGDVDNLREKLLSAKISIKAIVHLLELDKLRCVEIEFISMACSILLERRKKQKWRKYDFGLSVQ